MDINDGIDHSRLSMKHAQRLANLFVDEARLSPNQFKKPQDEKDMLIANFDPEVVKMRKDNGDIKEEELYIFE